MSSETYIVSDHLPREGLPGVYWLGGCSNSGAWPGSNRAASHEPLAAYVIVGSEKTLMVDTGHYGHWYAVDGQLDAVLGDRHLDYIFPSHQEIPHAGNLGRLMEKYPGAVAVGDVRDYHLFHPEIHLDRLQMKHHGERLDLGGREFVFLDAVWKDLTGTMWGIDTGAGALFTADGFGYTHMHDEALCGLLPDELPNQEIMLRSERFALPFVGMRFTDPEPPIARFRELMEAYPVEAIASAHCCPITGSLLQPVIDKAIETLRSETAGPPPTVGAGVDAVAVFREADLTP